jgi:hypothetical protein
MRINFVVATLIALIAGSPFDAAQADPYPWCAAYNGSRGNGGTNCYMRTLQQCREAISGVGGFCQPNPFYDGRPVGPGNGAPPRQKRRTKPRS